VITCHETSSRKCWTEALGLALCEPKALHSSATPEEIRPLVQRLLADRYRLAVTKQTQTRPIYRLVRARRDEKVPKGLTPDLCPIDTSNGQPPPCNTIAGGPSSLIGISVTMPQFAKQLSSWPYAELGRLVIDATGLDGTYKLSMQYAATREYEVFE
jgi:uncharacterized protein (TIGR03435 family)